MFRTLSGDVTRHLKGIKLTLDSCKEITFETLADLVSKTVSRVHFASFSLYTGPQQDRTPTIGVPQRTITRDAVHIGLLRQREVEKAVRNTNSKRITPVDSRMSFPYGWSVPFTTVNCAGDMVTMSE